LPEDRQKPLEDWAMRKLLHGSPKKPQEAWRDFVQACALEGKRTRSEGHDIDVLLEALGDIAPAPDELRYENDQCDEEDPRTKAGNGPTNEN
jgi:hypothetical protein